MADTSTPQAADETGLRWPLPRSCPHLPPDALAELRQGPPRLVGLPDGTAAWLISRHADVKDALANRRLGVDERLPGFPKRIAAPLPPRAQSFWRIDPPEHGRLRRMVTQEFTAHNSQRLRPRIERVVGELLDELAAGPRPADLVAGFAMPLPCIVIGGIFGIPDEDMAMFKEQTGLLLAQNVDPAIPAGAMLTLLGYLGELVKAKSAEPGDDLLSRLAVEHVATGGLDPQDLLFMVGLMLVAGHETTANQIALSILTLLRNPALAERLRTDAGAITPFVEESLRYWSIAQDNVVRVALADVEIGGTLIAEGEGVIVSIPSANHDEAVFAGADEFDPDRDSREHLAFGRGIHHCPGAPLARLELEVALPALLRRFPGLRLAVAEDAVPFRTDTLVFGLESLPAAW